MEQKKLKIIMLLLAVLILCTATYFIYQYYQKGTPYYSFKQLQSAYNDHDTEKFNKYYDQEQIFDNLSKRLSTKKINVINSSSDSELLKQILIGEVNNTTTISNDKQSFEQEIYDTVTGKIKRNEDVVEYKGFLPIFLNSKPVFKVNGKIATTDILFDNYTYKNSKNYPVYEFKILLKQQDDRSWHITDIQGFEDYYGGYINDTVRLKDLTTISALINQYLAAGEKPILTNDNWRQALKDYSNKIGGDSFLPEDPTVNYSDSNKYMFSIINADSLKTYSYILKAKFSSISNGVFKGNIFPNFSYSDAYKKLSKENNNVLGLDCNAPAYCYSVFGHDSEWFKLLEIK